MSKPDKAATRSHRKSAWNPQPFTLVKRTPPDTSWWLVAAGPEDRERFIAVARQRALDAWTNVAPHAMNPRRGEFA